MATNRDHVCPTSRPCVYCRILKGEPLPPNVYVFPRRDLVDEDSMIPLNEDVVFQRFRRLPPRAKHVLASLIEDVAKTFAL